MKALQIIHSAYRCNLEEQDDPCLWITAAMRGAGAELGVLLRGNAVHYAVVEQDASELTLGSRTLRHPPCPDRDLSRLMEKGVPVHVLREDVRERGIPEGRWVKGVALLEEGQLAALLSTYDEVWHW